MRVGKQKPGKPIEIMTNQNSQRYTPNYLAFLSETDGEQNLTGLEWVVGVDAERAIRKNPKHGVQNPFYYLNNNQDFPLKEYVTPIEASAIALATYLKPYKRKTDKVIIAVPSVFSPQARRNLMDSLKLISISSAQLINSNTALAALYAIEKLPISDNVTRKVLFVDIGAIQTELSLWNFDRKNQTITITLDDYRFSDEIGGYLIDDLLMNFTLKQLNRKPIDSEMPIIRRAVIKAKERLAAGGHSFIDLNEDFSQRIPLYVDNVTELASDIIAKFDKMLEGLSDSTDEVEMVGGSTRLPCFINSLTKAFGEKPHRSMNSDEAVALGSAYFAALQSGTINGAILKVVKPSLFGIAFEFNNQSTDVFIPGDKIERKTVVLRKFTDFNFTLVQTRDPSKFPHISTSLIPKENKTYSIVSVKNLVNLTRSITKQIVKKDKPYLSLMFDISQQLDCLDFITIALHANITVNATIGNESISQVTSTSYPLKYENNIIENVLDFPKSKELLDGIRGYRRQVAQQRKSLNNLLDFIIDTNEKLSYSSDMKAVSTPEERAQVQQMLARERQSVDLAGSRVSSAELEKRLASIKERIGNLLTRFEEYSKRPRIISDLNKTILRAEKEIPKAICGNETLNDFIKFLNDTKQLIQDAEAMNPLEQPVITIKKLTSHKNALLKRLPLLRSPTRKEKGGSLGGLGSSVIIDKSSSSDSDDDINATSSNTTLVNNSTSIETNETIEQTSTNSTEEPTTTTSNVSNDNITNSEL